MNLSYSYHLTIYGSAEGLSSVDCISMPLLLPSLLSVESVCRVSSRVRRLHVKGYSRLSVFHKISRWNW